MYGTSGAAQQRQQITTSWFVAVHDDEVTKGSPMYSTSGQQAQHSRQKVKCSCVCKKREQKRHT